MADATKGSFYDAYWKLIRDHRWKRNQPNDPKNVIELVVPPEHQAKVIKAIRKRKWLEQAAKGRDYGTLLATCHGDVIRFRIEPPDIEKI